jgi:CRISPR-associated protein Cas2
MWLFAMFDLPVDTADARRRYTQFRKTLLKEGFTMLQFSVYVRYCASEDASAAYRRRVRAAIPENGEVRLLGITDHQFGKMEVHYGRIRRKTELPPEQLLLF